MKRLLEAAAVILTVLFLSVISVKAADQSVFKITAQPKDYIGVLDEKAVFKVTVKGDTDLTYRWQFSTDNGKTWKASKISGYKTAKGSVEINKRRAQYLYRCRITNKAGKRLYTNPVQMVIRDPEISVRPKDYTGTIGDTASFKVTLRYGNGAKYQWQYSSDSGKTWKTSKITGCRTAAGSIAVSEKRMKYLYRCRITGANGKIIYTDPVKMVLKLSDYSNDQGRSFYCTQILTVPWVTNSDTLTVEAAVMVPKSLADPAGVVIGTQDGSQNGMDFGIDSKGHPCVDIVLNGKKYSCRFSADVRGDKPARLAWVIKGKDSCTLYVDGVKKQQVSLDCALPFIGGNLTVGNDRLTAKVKYFKGKIYDLRLYDTMRSTSEIMKDASGKDAEKGAAASYRFKEATDTQDLSGNGRTLYIPAKGFCCKDNRQRYSLEKTFASQPKTYEALIECSADVSNKKGCTIVGNYADTYTPGVTFRIYLDGRPQLCLRYGRDRRTGDSSSDKSLGQDQFTINESILGKGPVHVAFTVDDRYVCGYLNGVLKLKKEHRGFMPEITEYAWSVGGDQRNDNSWYFRDGAIHTVNLFSTCRTEKQILKDMDRVSEAEKNLQLSFDFSTGTTERSKNHNDYYPYLYDREFVSPDSYDFTLVGLGDIQSLLRYNSGDLHYINDFLLANRETMKIERLIGLGDITQYNTAEEWRLVRNQMKRLDGKIPYSLVRGNHDKTCQTPEELEICEGMFARYFDNETYRSMFTGAYQDDIRNTYTLTEICGIKYLFITLDYGAGDDILNWAGEIIAAHPDYQVIISTHCFLFRDGTTLDGNDLWAPTACSKDKNDFGENDGDDMWDKLVSKYENIVLVLSGHDPTADIVTRQFKGDNGNIVTCCLIDAQDMEASVYPLGMVALFHFSDGGKKVTVEYYSTVQKKFFKKNNQFSILNFAG